MNEYMEPIKFKFGKCLLPAKSFEFLVHVFFVGTKWETNSLKEAVAMQQRMRLTKELYEKLQNSEVEDSAAKFEEENERIEKMTDESLHALEFGGINWEKVSDSLKSKSAVECEQQWRQKLFPGICRAAFTPQEQSKLKESVERHSARNWEQISSDFPDRTSLQCARQHLKRSHQEMVKGSWSSEEDELLKQAVSRFGARNWQHVAQAVGTRKSQQCQARWKETRSPHISKGGFSLEQDKRLGLAMKALGEGQWAMAEKFVPGKTDQQCRERWANVLKVGINRKPWTELEDAALQIAVLALGESAWAEVAKRIDNRTDSQCRRRWLAKNPEKDKRKRKQPSKRNGAEELQQEELPSALDNTPHSIIHINLHPAQVPNFAHLRYQTEEDQRINDK